MRQRVEWQSKASEQLSIHEIAEPLKAYSDHGNIHFAENDAAAHKLVVEKWNKLRADKPSESRMVLVATNKERKNLNRLMRDEIKKEGGLQNDVDVATTDGLRQMAVGESVMFTAGDKILGVKNGTVGIIESINNGIITIATDNGHKVQIPADGKGTESGNAIEYFYATTVHKSQGMSIDNVVAMLSPNMALENTLVILTRHKNSLDAVCNKQQFENLDALIKGLDRTGRKDFSHDAEKLEWSSACEKDDLVSQYKADFAHERVIEHAAKSAKFTELRDNLDARQLLDRLAKSHGVDVALYGITKNKDGHDRIQCGSRQLNVSDFLVKEMHLNYKAEAATILREVYAAQLEKVYAPHREAGRVDAIANHEVNKPMWKEFTAYQEARTAEYKTASTALSEDAKGRKAAIAKKAFTEKTIIKNSIASYPAKSKEIKQARANAADALKNLRSETNNRKGVLMAEYKKPHTEQYKAFLEIRAINGDTRAIAEFKRIALTKDDMKRLDVMTAIHTKLQSKIKTPVHEITANKLTVDDMQERINAQSRAMTTEAFDKRKAERAAAIETKREAAAPIPVSVPALTTEQNQIEEIKRLAAEHLDSEDKNKLFAEVGLSKQTVQPQLSAVEWISAQHKPQVQPYKFGDGVEFTVAYISCGVAVINHGRGAFAEYPIPPDINLHVDQKITISKAGVIVVPTAPFEQGGKGRAD